jgi:hypothetical protein
MLVATIKILIILSEFNENLISRQILEKFTNRNFIEDSLHGKCVLQCEKTK